MVCRILVLYAGFLFCRRSDSCLGHSYVGSEHLLLGILREKKGLSMKILDIFDCDVDGICAMVEDMIKASGGTMTLGHLPLTRRAERILRNAYNEATALGISVADDEHLLRATVVNFLLKTKISEM